MSRNQIAVIFNTIISLNCGCCQVADLGNDGANGSAYQQKDVYIYTKQCIHSFRKEKGMSLKEYIICEKMKTAQAILRSTNLPVAVVAARVGFENYSYFSQVYKKVIGVNPSAERSKNPDT